MSALINTLYLQNKWQRLQQSFSCLHWRDGCTAVESCEKQPAEAVRKEGNFSAVLPISFWWSVNCYGLNQLCSCSCCLEKMNKFLCSYGGRDSLKFRSWYLKLLDWLHNSLKLLKYYSNSKLFTFSFLAFTFGLISGLVLHTSMRHSCFMEVFYFLDFSYLF